MRVLGSWGLSIQGGKLGEETSISHPIPCNKV